MEPPGLCQLLWAYSLGLGSVPTLVNPILIRGSLDPSAKRLIIHYIFTYLLPIGLESLLQHELPTNMQNLQTSASTFRGLPPYIPSVKVFHLPSIHWPFAIHMESSYALPPTTVNHRHTNNLTASTDQLSSFNRRWRGSRTTPSIPSTGFSHPPNLAVMPQPLNDSQLPMAYQPLLNPQCPNTPYPCKLPLVPTLTNTPMD